MKNVFILDAIRTPIGNFGGTLSNMRADDLAARPLAELIKRNPNTDWEQVEDVLLGCANQAGEDNRNIARMALLLAGLPHQIGGETINRLCSSGMAAAVNAYRAISIGEGELYITGGVEHMTRGPWVISKVSKPFGRDAQMHDSSFGWRFINPIMQQKFGTDGMGQTAENLVEMYGISREDQDLFAYRSQMKATTATENGRLDEEICKVILPQRKKDDIVFEKDEFIKPATTLEKLGSLRAAFKKEGGSVTAGNSSQLSDGASVTLVMSEDKAKELNLKPLAYFRGFTTMGCEPDEMGIGPIYSVPKLLKNYTLSLDDIDVWELNEAFAVQVVYCRDKLGIPMDKLNLDGGSISIGHPFGMTGSRQVGHLARQLRNLDKQFVVVTMCVGGGMGASGLFERYPS